ncbi:MAG: hypothetical protein DHS20C01_36500 [marine bacterium B5-7]|nr:MAG: hypothetical protein DHS20C01_36500 [marine bacterium B5-7]
MKFDRMQTIAVSLTVMLLLARPVFAQSTDSSKVEDEFCARYSTMSSVEKTVYKARFEDSCESAAKMKSEVDLMGRILAITPIAATPGETHEIRVQVENLNVDSDRPKAFTIATGVFPREPDLTLGGNVLDGAIAVVKTPIDNLPDEGAGSYLMVSIDLPANLPDTDLYWCVIVDPDRHVKESDQHNNVDCRVIAQSLTNPATPSE